jgi:hypothetical protein
MEALLIATFGMSARSRAGWIIGSGRTGGANLVVDRRL